MYSHESQFHNKCLICSIKFIIYVQIAPFVRAFGKQIQRSVALWGVFVFVNRAPGPACLGDSSPGSYLCRLWLCYGRFVGVVELNGSFMDFDN